jgi:hypothetical protein
MGDRYHHTRPDDDHREELVMQRPSKPTLTMFTLLASWLIGVAFARAEGNSNGSETPSGATPGLVLIMGGAAERQREIVGQTIEAAVRDAGWSLPAKPLTKSQSDSMLTCFDAKPPASCIPAQLRIARVFVVTIENKQADNGAPMVVLIGKALLIEPPSTAIRQQHCERCASNDLTAASAELAKIVLRDLALSAGTTIAEFRSEPEGAEIVLDGRRIGATNARFNTYPGKHVVRFEKPGYLAETREFTAEEDKSVPVAAVLRPSNTGEPPIRPPPSKLVPGILFGASGVLLLTGVVGIYYGTKGDSDDKYRYPRALPIGISSAVVGVGAAGVGVYLLWKGSRSSAPTVGVTSGGAVLGWMGTFR